MYGYFLARPMSQLASLYGQLQHARASAARVVEVLKTDPEPRGKPGRVLSNVRGEIEFRQVHFSYPERGPVLNGVELGSGSIRIHRLGVVGPSSTRSHRAGRFDRWS